MKILTAFALTLAALAGIQPAAAYEPLPRATPIRRAAVKIKVSKTYLGYRDTIEKNDEFICEIKGEVPVYAPADWAKLARLHADFHCDTALDGRAIRVQVSSSVQFDDATAESPAKKRLRAMMFVTFLDDLTVYASQPAYVATTDLNTKNLELQMNSGTYELDELKSGRPAYRAIITADDDL